MLSPPPRYVPSQDFSQSMPSLNTDGQFGSATGGEPFVCSYQKAIDENPLSPTTEQRRTKHERVIDEIISTELSYVNLSQIIEGYQTPLVENMDSLGVTDGDILALFNNIEEIKDFNEFMLKNLQQCKDDIKRIAKCFIRIWENAEGFKIYSDYCTKYPRAIEVWGKYAKHTAMINFFKKCQQKLGHMLPLGDYLLKPVQRVLKYSLLLEKINDCLSTGEDGKEDIIDTFRYLGGKPVNTSIGLTTERHLILFQRLLLMTKKKEDHFVYKQHINVCNCVCPSLCVELNDFGNQLIIMIAINNRELDHACYPYLCLVKIWTTKANTIALKFRKL
ncbi:pleckstrin homology domain-containing family G member 1-like isoform X2 [Dysidea avara]|uniref:pleckstrin homology domain-containing family G member 1-like isoform X2 n=1 Tax=Dysidea avara TaxID=196820 RepID=UPI00332A2F58